MKKIDLFCVDVVNSTTGNVVHTLGGEGKPEREAEKIERGLLRNLDTDRYHTNVRPLAQKASR